MRKSFHLIVACALVPGGCASFKKEPVKMTAITAVALPIGIAAVIPLGLMKIAGDLTRSSRPWNEQPMYGGHPKTPAMIAADERFIGESAKYGDRAHASDMSVALGWRYFREGDIATAMKRFNQAWLLDPDNGDAFHGFAVLVMERDHDAVQADRLFREGLAKPRQSPGIYLDYGRFLLMTGKPADAVAPLRHALAFPDMGPNVEALLTLALYRSGDIAAACAERARVQDNAEPAIRDAARALKECKA
jgi:tetratricopeptide (TPR) repeat protein